MRESEEKFSKAFATSPHAITITRASDGSFIEANSAFNSMMGYSAAEIAGSSTLGLQIWARQEDRKKVIASLRAGQPVVNQEYLFRTKHGEMITGLFSAQTIKLNQGLCLLSSVADISDRKRAEALVEEIKTRDEAILNSIGDAVFACDKDGIILLFNQMAADMTGIPIKEAIGHHYRDTITFIKESNGKPCDDCIAKAIKSHVITKMANHVMLVRQDGSRIPVADSAAPIKDAAGDVMGCVVVFHDVTRERQIDKAKTEFVSLASHQLRTPLSTINWYVEMLLSLDVGQLTTKQRQYSEEVYHASQRMVNLVNSLLNVSRLELGTLAVDPELVDITKIAATCLKDLRPLILKKKLAVTEKYDKKIAKVKADPKLLAMIFENFLSNSVKYTNPGGKIELTITENKEGVRIAVTDNGIGIPQCQQAEICTKLFRADNAKQLDPDGTGLGLYIVREIVNYTGGQIGFTSHEGKGSTFYANLPLAGMTKKSGSKGLV
jgi:PAS domain S-box-containing protein